MTREHASRLTDEELEQLRDLCACARPLPPRRPRSDPPPCRPEDRALVTRRASSFGFSAIASADTAAAAYRKARSLANAAAHEAFAKDYRPTVLRAGGHTVIIWHDPRASWYGVLQPDGSILPILPGEPAQVEQAARKALQRLCGESE